MIIGETVKRVSKPFQLSAALISANETKMIPSVRDPGCHERGPFSIKDVSLGSIEYYGKVSIKTGNRSVRFRKPDCYAYIQLIMGRMPHDYKNTSPIFNNLLLVTPSWFTVHEAFRLYGQYLPGYNSLLTPVAAQILTSTNKFSYKLRLPFLLSVPSSEDVLDIKVNSTTSPGGFTRRFFKNLTDLEGIYKKDVVYFSYSLFKEKWQLVTSGAINIDNGYYGVGGREKIQQVDVSKDDDVIIDDITGETHVGTLLGTRPVMIPEFHDIMFDSVLLTPIMKHFKAYGAESSEVWVGHSLAHLGWVKMKTTFEGSVCEFEGDASRFDRNVLNEVIKASFGRLRSCYPISKTMDLAFKNAYDRFTNKVLVTPDGHTFRLNKGIPSGNVFTSMIGSLCTWHMWYYAFQFSPVFISFFKAQRGTFKSLDVVTWISKNIKFACYGDDLKLGVTFLITKDDMEKLGLWFEMVFNYKIRSDSTLVVKEAVDDKKNRASFLRMAIHDGLPSVKTWDLWEKILFGAIIRKDDYNVLQYVYNRITSLMTCDTDDIRPIAFRATLVYFCERAGITGERALNMMMEKLNIYFNDLNKALLCFCSVVNISVEVFNNEVEDFMKCVVRNHEKIYMTVDSDTITYDWGEDQNTKLLRDIWDMEINKNSKINIRYTDYYNINLKSNLRSSRQFVL